MRGVAALIPALAAGAALLVAGPAGAQMQPHRAEYSLRLGTAINATRIGTVVQDIALECDGWHIRRELSVDMSFTPSLRASITWRMEGEEQRNGSGFAWRAVQVVNGAKHEMQGTVQKREGAYRVEATTPDGPEQSMLPSFTHMPVAALSYLVGRLMAGSDSIAILMFATEASGSPLLIDAKRSAGGTAATTLPSRQRVEVPGTQSWPLTMAITGMGQQAKPLVTLRARLSDSGVLQSLVADARMITVAAQLQGLQMHEAPNCPK